MTGDVTRLLERWGGGDREASAELISLVYQELHAMARSQMRRERPGHTLQCTAFVHEAYLRPVTLDAARWENRAQFHPPYRSNLARSQRSIGNAESALGRRSAACAAWREGFRVYSGLDQDGKLREEERDHFEALRTRLASCPD